MDPRIDDGDGDGGGVMERRQNLPDFHAVRVATRNFNSLKGWTLVPFGVGLLLWDVTEGVQQVWLALGVLVAWGLAWLYYRRVYGVVRRSREQVRLETGYVALFVLGWMVALIPVSRGWHPPVDPTLLVLAAALLSWWAIQYRGTRGLDHHVVAAAGLAVQSLAPSVVSDPVAYYRDTSMDLFALAAGVTFIVVGVLDHAFLARTLRHRRRHQEAESRETSSVDR